MSGKGLFIWNDGSRYQGEYQNDDHFLYNWLNYIFGFG